VILTGVLAHYLSLPGAATPYAEPIRNRLLASSPASTGALSKLLRLRTER
jgi:hypothetical protein